MSNTAITLYHYAKCSKSRATLALLESKGLHPTIVDYLDTPLTVNTLQKLVEQLNFSSVRQLMRTQEDRYKTLQLDRPTLSETELLQAIVAHPILLERPIVIYNNRARIGRPPEAILELF